jgi:hypothetical protein
VQKECINMCFEDGSRTLDTIHQGSVDLLTRELRNLNFDLGYRVSFHKDATYAYRTLNGRYMPIIFHIM